MYQDVRVRDGMVKIDVYFLSPFALLVLTKIETPNLQASITPTKPHEHGQKPITIVVKDTPDTADYISMQLSWLFMLLACCTLGGGVINKKKKRCTN